jgi:hypothetical protein
MTETDNDRTCVDCGITSPEARTDNTLVGKLGWRFLNRVNVRNVEIAEWRCPACWQL